MVKRVNPVLPVVLYGSADISGPECTFYRSPRFDNRQPYMPICNTVAMNRGDADVTKGRSAQL
jgi:hypothetical protein